MSQEEITNRWARNPSDAKAIANGCWFDEERASYVVWWIERYCKLYEGSDGDPLLLRGCGECNHQPIAGGSWFGDDGEPDAAVLSAFAERAKQHCACVAAGHFMDWQYETIMRLFGWVRWSEKWDRWVRRFRKASIWIAKKNKKSPTLAAIALYLLAGDGEPGQKVFLAAKDGLQAKEIAGKHAIEMLAQSDELTAECTVNKVMSQITHEPSRSILKPLSSSNSRTQQSKEGLNGSVLVDETHVVDREFIGRISRAGISRPEPLQCEFSTAGDNPDGYGKEAFDTALKVESGEIDDQELLAIVHAAPQDVTDEQLDADPLRYGYMANPAMGHTVDQEEYLTDYNRSKVTTEKLDEFKMYRLNVWRHAATPWLKQSDWRACAKPRDCTEDALAGRMCFAGLDLARVYDTTALALIFPPEVDNEPWKSLIYFWQPEETAKERTHLAPYATWEEQGALVLTPGNWGSDAPVREQIMAANRMFHLRKLAYDKRFSDSLILRLTEEDGLEEEQFEEFGQNNNSFSGPTDSFAGLVMAGTFAHPDNPLLNWQAGHVVLIHDNNKGKRPVKPKKGDFRTVDGIQALVMAHGIALKYPDEGISIYEQKGALRL